MERLGTMLVTTGPKRTLVDGLRSPAAVGGLEEREQSARGFPALDMKLIATVLERYDLATLWAAAGDYGRAWIGRTVKSALPACGPGHL